MKLFAYQKEAVASFLNDYHNGGKSGLLYLATGTGKTVIAAHIAKELQKPVLFFVHRDELAKQAISKISSVWPGVDIGLVKARTNELGCTVTVASIQSLQSKKRLDELMAANDYELLIQDECHHAAAPTWERAIKYFDCYHLGLSATPVRSDHVSLDHVFSKILYKYTIIDAIKDGYLSDIHGIKIDLRLSLDGIQYRSGDFNAQEAGRLFEQECVLSAMFDKWSEFASNRKTVAFACDVAHASAMADYFAVRGVAAEYVSGDLPAHEREARLRRFSLGKTQFLANCMILTEGWDEPAVNCILMARPTSSESLYIQSIGRGLRRFPGKENCLVLDFVAVSEKHKIMQLSDLIGIKYKNKRKYRKSDKEYVLESENDEIHSVRAIVSDVNAIEFYKKDAMLFEWIHFDNLLALNMGYNHYLIVRPTKNCGYEVVNCYLHGWRYTETQIYKASIQDLCISIAEDKAQEIVSRQETLKYQQKDYDNGFISQKQINIIKAAGHTVPDNSKAANKLISRIFFERFISDVSSDATHEQKNIILNSLFRGKISCSIKQSEIKKLKYIEAEKIIKFYANVNKYNYAKRNR